MNELAIIIKLANAIKPFAEIEMEPPKSIAPADVWLWKPSGSRNDRPGINLQNILDAKAALKSLEGGAA